MSDDLLLTLALLLVVFVIAVVMICRYRGGFSATLEGLGVKAELNGANNDEPGNDRMTTTVDDTTRRDLSGNVSVGGSADKATIVTGSHNKIGPSS